MTSAALLPVLLVWLVLAVVVGYVASQRGRSAVGLFSLSLVFSPLVGFLVAIGLPVRERRPVPMLYVELFGWTVVAVGVVVIVWVVWFVGVG